MQDYASLIITIIAGSVATVLGGLVLAKLQPKDPGSPGAQSATVVGDGNHVTQQSTTTRNTNITQQITKVEKTPTQPPVGGGSDDDDWVRIAGFALAGLTAALGFLVAWPYVVGAVVVFAVATLVATGAFWWLTAPGPYARMPVVIGNIAAGLGSLVASALVLRPFYPEHGVLGLTKQAALTVPALNGGTGQRWGALKEDFGGVVEALDIENLTSLMAQGAFAAFAMLTLMLAWRDLWAWWSFRRVAYGRTTSPAAVSRAFDFLDQRASSGFLRSLVMTLVACLFASGAIGKAAEWLQNAPNVPSA